MFKVHYITYDWIFFLLISGWCAKIYQHWRFNGWKKEVGFGQFDLLENENDEISSVKVRPGCTLKLFRDPNNVGLLDSLTTDADFLSGYNDQVSSFSCTYTGMI